MSSRSRKPDFIIAGATRSGTTTLHQVLRGHPDIFMPEKKELHFFDHTADYQKGEDFYSSYFNPALDNQVVGEATPSYFTHGYTVNEKGQHEWSPDDDSARRLHDMCPDSKLIISLRHPVDRAHSFFWRTVWQGHETSESLEQAFKEEMDGQRSPEKTPLCCMYLNRYKTHLEHWLNFFPKENICVVIMEEWSKEPLPGLDEITQFLGVSSFARDFQMPVVNQGRRIKHKSFATLARKYPRSKVMRFFTRHFFSEPGYQKITAEERKKLQPYFDKDIAAIESFLGRSIKVWRADT